MTNKSLNIMDEVDIQILKELTKDAQTPFLRIAEKIGVSPKTVQIRYNKMKQEGIILRSTITVDLSKLGFQGRAFLSITNAPNQNRKETIGALKQMQNIILLTEIIGDFDVLAIAAIKDLKSIISLVNAVRKLPSVDQVEVSFTDNTSFPVEKGFADLFQTKKEEPDA
jgi:Lrp/AsnC family transcriptional regulator for asnA, asnC and gidA